MLPVRPQATFGRRSPKRTYPEHSYTAGVGHSDLAALEPSTVWSRLCRGEYGSNRRESVALPDLVVWCEAVEGF